MSCADNFQPIPTAPTLCVPRCPQQSGFEYRLKDGAPVCVYTADESVYYQLESYSINDLTSPARDVAMGRTDENAAIAIGKIDNDVKLKTAFQKLQDAENARDGAPDAFEQARIAYYTLLKGDTWKEEESKRVARAEVNPVVQGYQDKLQSIQIQSDTQKRTIDVIQGVKDRVLSLKDDVKYSVDAFQKQIDGLKNQIQIERHATIDTEDTMWSLVGAGLNLFLVFILLALIVVVYRKLIATPLVSGQQSVLPSMNFFYNKPPA
jgi:hypothetical protein